MSQSSYVFSLFHWLRKLGRRRPQPARRKWSERGARPAVEMLEDRLAPASLSDAGGSLTITLDIPGETLTISGKGSNQYSVSSTQAVFNAGLTGATFSSGTLTLNSVSDISSSISIVDAVPGTSVDFAVGSGDFSQAINVNLSNPLAGGVSFTGSGTMTFDNGLSVATQAGSITSASTAGITVKNSGNLNLTADEGEINLQGVVNATNAAAAVNLTALDAINAANAGDDFPGFVTLAGPNGGAAVSASISSTAGFTLDNVDVSGGLTVNVTGGGSITESGTVGGAITATVTGSAPISIENDNGSGNFELGAIMMGTGDLNLTQGGDGNITQNGAIKTSGNVIVTIGSFLDQDVLLASAANDIAGTVTIGGEYQSGNIALRNTNPSASIGNLIVNSYYVDGLTLEFDNASITSTDWDNLGNYLTENNFDVLDFTSLSITAESIAEDSINDAVTVTGAASFTATSGDIIVGNTFNDFQGTVSASVTGTSSNIQLDNSAPTFTLGNISLVNGTLTINDDDTNGLSTIQQATGDSISTGESATIAVNISNFDEAATIELSSPTNDIPTGTHSISVTGNGALTDGDFGFGNSATGVNTLNQLTFSDFTIDSLTVALTGTVNLGNLYTGTLPLVSRVNNDYIDDTNLTVSSSGSITDSQPITVTGNATFTAATSISQSAADVIDGDATFTAGTTITQATALAVGGVATFTTTGNVAVNTDSIDLTNPSNSLADVSLNTPASDPGNVVFATSGALMLETSSLGTGTLSVTADGNISEDFDSSITQAANAQSATFTGGLLATTVDLGQPGDFDANFFTGQVIFAGTTVTTGDVEDQNPAATLASFTLPNSVQNFNVTLDFYDNDGNAVSSLALPDLAPVNFLTYNLDLVTTANIVLPSGSTFGLTGSNSLTLESESGDINLFGALTIGGTTTLETDSDSGAANNIIADNPANAFGTLDLDSDSFDGGTITIVSANTLTLGDSTIESASLTTEAITGGIAQSGSITTGLITAAADFITSGVDDVQTVTVSNATGGTFTLKFGSDTTGSIAFNAPVATVQTDLADLGDIGPGNVQVTGTPGNYNVTFIGALGASLQSGLVATSALTGVGNNLSVTPTTPGESGGAIDLDQTNSFAGPVSASTDTLNTGGTATDAITFNAAGTITLGSINPQDGAVNVSATSGIGESSAFGGIVCSAGSTATLSFTVTGGGAPVDLSAGPNNIPSTAIVSVTGSSTPEDLGFRNVNAAATMAQVQLHSFTTVQDLTVAFDNASINFNTAAGYTFASTGDLSLTAGGNITQSSAIVTSGTVTLSLEDNGSGNGDGSIILDNATNAISGTVSFSAPDADNKQQISFFNTGSISLGGGEIGLASLSLTADGGNITQVVPGGITQDAGGGPITLNATGNTIDLGNRRNDFTGPVTFTSGIDDVQTVTVSATAGTFTLKFGADTTAAIAFNATPATVQADLAALADIGAGKVQVTGVPGSYVATFVGALGGSPQSVMSATSTNLTGGSHTASVAHTVTGIDSADLAIVGFGNSDDLATLPKLIGALPVFTSVTYAMPQATIALPSIDTGTLYVTAGGNIAQQSSTALTVTGEATFTTGNYGIQLANSGNNINEISLNNGGENAVSVATTGALIIDTSFLGSGALNITAGGAITETGGDGIEEELGPNDVLAGVASFTVTAAGDPILLDNTEVPGNEILGPINVSTTGTNGVVTIVNDASTILDVDKVGGAFTVDSSESLSQAPGGSFTVGGDAYFNITGFGGINLVNPGNSVTGTVGVNSQDAATLVLTGAATLVSSTVSFGPLDITASGAINGASAVINAEGGNFTSATGNITLADAANNFNESPVSLSAPAGSISLTDSDTDGLELGQVVFGSGGLTVNAAGDISESNTVTGSGSVTLTNSTASPITLTMTNPANDISGAGSFALSNFGNVSITNPGGNIELTSGSTLADTAQVTLIAGGIVDLPNGVSNTLTLGNLSVSAHQTNVDVNLVATDLVVGGGGNAISFTGAVDFSGPVTLDASADVTKTDITFNGNVTTTGPITVDLPSSGELILAGGDWMEGASDNLTINGPSVTVDVQAGATMSIAAGDSVFMTGEPQGGGTPSAGNSLDVEGTVQVGGAVTLSDGGTDSVITANISGTFLDFLAATPGSFTLNGTNPSDQINVAPTALISGFGGTAPANPATIVQIDGGGIISGVGANPANNLGELLMGTDIVTATQTPTSVSIQQATGAVSSVSGTATFTGNEPDGDKVTITATQTGTGTSLTLMAIFAGTLSTGYDGMDIVVRGATANNAAPITLTITTTPNGGDGFTLINGIAIDGSTTAADTITASLSNIEDGNIVTSGPLAALTLHNWNGGFLQTSTAATSVTTTITGTGFNNVNMSLDSVLKTLTLAADTGASTISATSFGTIAANGNAAGDTPGNFAANLVDSASATAALTKATIAGTLTGNWELAGSVGTVTASVTGGESLGWALGVPNGPGVVNAGLLTNVTSLTLGTVTNGTIFASGNVGTITAISVNDTGVNDPGTLQANSFGTIATTGETTKLDRGTVSIDHGNFIANITATGNAGSTTKDALGTLSVAGDLGAGTPPITLLFLDGNVGSITVGELANCANIDAVTGTGVGNIGSITAGAWEGSQFNANNVTSMAMKGNLPAQLLGSFDSNTVILTGTLGTFSTTQDTEADFTVEGGSVTSFTVGGALSGSTIDLTATAATASLGTITAAEWQNDTVAARTIGTLQSLGRPAIVAAASGFDGDISDTTITAFEPTNLPSNQTVPGIGTFSATGTVGDLPDASPGTNYIVANNGITSLTAGRSVNDEQIAADLNGGTGGIGTLTAGAWANTDLTAFSIGTFNVTGYGTPELATAFVPGDVTDSQFVINGSSATTHNGINTMTVQHNLGDTTVGVSFNVPFGIGTLSVAGAILGTTNQNSVIDTRNPLAPASGLIGTITVGEIQNVNIYADEVSGKTGIKVAGSTALGLNGDFDASTLAVAGFTGTASAPVGVTAFTLAGNLDDSSTVEVADGITTFTVAQSVENSSIAVAFDPVNINASIKTLTAGAIDGVRLTAGSIGVFNVIGNTNFGLAGNLADSLVTITGNLAGIALGAFTATGHVQTAAIQVTSGNVTSFKTAAMIGSGLFIGYVFVDPADISDANNGQTANWEGIFTLGSFTTTAVPNNSASFLSSTAGFEASDVVAAKLGAVVISGLEPNLPISTGGFGFGFRTTGGAAATTFTVAGVSESHGNSALTGNFFYIGLGG